MYQKTCLKEERRKMWLNMRYQQQHPLQQGQQIHAKEAERSIFGSLQIRWTNIVQGFE
jgi:hypothetical protein